MSNSTLRRKLFEGILDEDDIHPDPSDTGEDDIDPIENVCEKSPDRMICHPDKRTENEQTGKENIQPLTNVNITPGAILLTPKTNSIGPTPDRMVCLTVK